MRREAESAGARRYLLGEASEEECAAIEREYFENEDAVDRMAAVEDDLIEDYLSSRLDAGERARFERVYLAVPHHRRRLEIVRRLTGAASRPAVERAAKDSARSFLPAMVLDLRLQWLAAAAALVIAAGALWMLVPSGGDRATVAENQQSVPTPPEPSSASGIPSQPQSSSPSPRIFAVSISPVTVRSAADSPSVIIPAGTDVVALSLEGATDGRTLTAGRASIRTVTGDVVWQGPAIVGGDLPPDVLARFDVPAASLPVDDYVVTLFGAEGTGTEQERSRYFLRVRAP